MEAGAGNELAAFAERLGAPVFAENTTAHGRLPMPADHPLYAGILPYWSPEIHELLAEFDVIFAVGLNLLRLYIYAEPARPIPAHVRIIQLDNVPWQIGKNYPVEVGLIGDPYCGLAELRDLLDGNPAAAERRRRWATKRKADQDQLQADIAAQGSRQPMTPLALMGALARVLPANAAVVEEAITTHHNVLERLGVLRDPSGHFAHRGWALGWGLGCALGVKLAWPDRPVLALLGDGAALYGIQGLWTAAHESIPVTFVVCNNAQYKILKVCADKLPLPQMSQGNFLAMDMVRPQVDFVGLARAFGVEAARLTTPAEVSELVRASLRGDKPRLFEVVIQ
jgi:benzoylformate decarboxylase